VSALPERVRIVEVGPRDGLQNEARPVPTSAKIELVEDLVDAGLLDVEVTSFVRGDRVPQLADGEQVFAGIEKSRRVRYWALVPNAKGLARARAAGALHVAVFTAATDGFNRANVNATVAESLAQRLRVHRVRLPVRGRGRPGEAGARGARAARCRL
jgi:hydroxymethylglutaryl-CoA lyase